MIEMPDAAKARLPGEDYGRKLRAKRNFGLCGRGAGAGASPLLTMGASGMLADLTPGVFNYFDATNRQKPDA